MKQELIGLHIMILDSNNKNLIGMQGKIVDETKNMFTIKTNEGEKKLIKNNIKFEVITKEGIMKIEGKKIVGRPEDRLKK
ncbi:MAG: ribonuclease P protein subunit [Candidatus Nanoarchaeia archaeon]|nr:ribonuclease P protein subunit [Candidatus Nanoarchaeia archaeon]